MRLYQQTKNILAAASFFILLIVVFSMPRAFAGDTGSMVIRAEAANAADLSILYEKLEDYSNRLFRHLEMDETIAIGVSKSCGPGMNFMEKSSSGRTSPADVAVLQLKSHKLKGAFINAAYHYETDMLELGLGSDQVNRMLPEKMKMEVRACPKGKSAALMFSVKL